METEYRIDDISESACLCEKCGFLADWVACDNILTHDSNAYALFQEEAFRAIGAAAAKAGLRRGKGVRRWVTVSCLEQNPEIARERVLAVLRETKKERVVVSVLVPEPDALPGEVEALAEREFSCALARKQALTPAERLCAEVEDLCRHAVRDEGKDVVLLRLQNVFGPGIDFTGGFDFGRFAADLSRTGTIVAEASDAVYRTAFTYCTDALLLSQAAAFAGRSGHVYNLACMRASRLQIKEILRDVFAGRFGFSANLTASPAREHHALHALKLLTLYLSLRNRVIERRQFGVAVQNALYAQRFPDQLYRTVASALGRPYDMARKLRVYSGKLGIIREQEMRMLKLVDGICRKNGIRYFLAGGSLLGAVRHKAMIPWDDDLDIGMLREDFEKFRRLCPGLVPETHTYESPWDGRKDGSHYHFDKVRLKGTYFSTKYSSHFRMNDGVFLDIIIYDRTSNIKAVAWAQIYALWMWTGVLNNRWWNRPLRRRAHYWFWFLAMPFIRLLPMQFCHWVFERMVRLFARKRNARFLIDGIGQNIKKGPFPREWLEKTELMDFGDFRAPVPVGYDGYLRHFYGPRYMEWLPIGRRVSGHNLVRVDMGPFIFADAAAEGDRKLDVRGELHE